MFFIIGGIECVTIWPLEYIKTQLQLQSTAKGAVRPYTGTFSGLVYTVKTTGFLSLYRGLTVTLVGTFPKAGIRFGANAWFKNTLMDENGKLTSQKHFLAGVGAGTSEAILAVTPMETIKTRLIETNQTFLKGIVSMVKENGIGSIYKGVVATILKQSSNQGLRFMFYNKYKDLVTERSKLPLSTLEALAGGMVSRFSFYFEFIDFYYFL